MIERNEETARNKKMIEIVENRTMIYEHIKKNSRPMTRFVYVSCSFHRWDCAKNGEKYDICMWIVRRGYVSWWVLFEKVSKKIYKLEAMCWENDFWSV